MRACSPSSPGSTGFLGAVEDSEWLNQLSNLLQLSGAIVDLIDLQNSSVLVALEKGWDHTAQVCPSVCLFSVCPYLSSLRYPGGVPSSVTTGSVLSHNTRL